MGWRHARSQKNAHHTISQTFHTPSNCTPQSLHIERPTTRSRQTPLERIEILPAKALLKPNIDSTCLRLTEDVRRKHHWSTHGDGDNSDYNPKLHIRSQWTAPEAPAPLELALQNFQTALHQQTRDNLSAQPRQHNLPASHRKLLQELSNNKDFTITATDKNLRPAILERSVYKQCCLSDHLEDKNTYQRLAPDDVTLRMASAEGAMHPLIKRHEKHLSRAETVYFTRCLQEPRRVPQFYCTPKVHKTPWATRP